MNGLTATWSRVLGGSALGLMMMACNPFSSSWSEISISVEVIGADLPIAVSATEPVRDGEGQLRHGVVVSWQGEVEIGLDDARFTKHIEGRDGDLIVAGRGCGAQWDEGELSGTQVLIVCTRDLRPIRLTPGERHEYPVVIYPEVGPRSLGRGTYVTEETIRWWRLDGTDPWFYPAAGQEEGSFVVRLTYEVR